MNLPETLLDTSMPLAARVVLAAVALLEVGSLALTLPNGRAISAATSATDFRPV